MARLFPFGLTKDQAVAELRQLADEIEAGRAIPHKILTTHRRQHDDFHMRVLAITYSQGRDADG